MGKIILEILNDKEQVKFGKNDYEEVRKPMRAEGNDRAYLATQDLIFEEGDRIRIQVASPNTHLVVKLDETLDSSLIFLKETTWDYLITMTDNAQEARPDNRFSGKRHYLSVRVATPMEINSYRNLALNPHDQKNFSGAFPHAYANVETRNDATFFACNAIDGIFANHSHGSYPYQSWGINQQKDAALSIDFGRIVELDRVGFTLRADFPHDNYWESVTLHFSDGTSEIFHTIKSDLPQYFDFSKRQVDGVVFSELKQSTDSSPFPALTEIELFGQSVSE